MDTATDKEREHSFHNTNLWGRQMMNTKTLSAFPGLNSPTNILQDPQNVMPPGECYLTHTLWPSEMLFLLPTRICVGVGEFKLTGQGDEKDNS